MNSRGTQHARFCYLAEQAWGCKSPVDTPLGMVLTERQALESLLDCADKRETIGLGVVALPVERPGDVVHCGQCVGVRRA